MAIHLIIDGYNLIRQSPQLRKHDQEDLEKGRKMLLKKLLAYKRIKQHVITVVFDGWMEGHFSEGHERTGGIEVIFSRRGEKADEVIKRLASQQKGKALIVTSDRDLESSCARQGCEVISSPEFEAKMELSQYIDLKGNMEEDDYESFQSKGTKKKGPSRRLPKSQRHHQKIVKKL